MHSNGPSGRVTNSTGNVGQDGEIVGYRGTGTMIDPGRYEERPGLDARIAASLTAAQPQLVDEQLAGIRRMLNRQAVTA